MAKEVSLKITYLQAPGIKKPSVVKLHQDIKEAGYDFFKNNPEYGPSFLLFASGVRSAQLEEKTKGASEKGIDQESSTALEGINLRLRTLEEEERALFEDLKASYPEGSVGVELDEFREEPGYISLKPSADSTNYELSSNSAYGNLSADLGPAKEMAGFALNHLLAPVKKKVAEKVAAKAATAIATKVGAKTATRVVTQALGTTVPGIGNVAAFVATEVLSRVWNFLKNIASSIKRFFKSEDSKELRWLATLGSFFGGLYLIGSGNIIFGLPLTAAGGLGTLGMLSAAHAGTTVAGLGQAAISGLTTVVLPTIGTPVLIALLTVPVLVAIILFIINSGAYIVPPSQLLAPGENPYISITKEASETEFENSDLPITVTYTITITPKKGALTNIIFSHKCEVISSRPLTHCPAPLPAIIPVLISPTQPYVYTYTQTYTGGAYPDSLVLNSFTITADTDEVTGTSATGAASIIIGNPPTDCYVLAGNWPEKPVNYKATIWGAIVYLTSNHSKFVSLVCSGGEVRIHYAPAGTCGVWGCARHSGDIELTPGGLRNPATANYILTHESGHLVSWRIPSLMQQYLDYPGVAQERPLCSYSPETNSPDEAFPESAALYVVPTINGCVSPSYPAKYPAHYNFADTHLF